MTAEVKNVIVEGVRKALQNDSLESLDSQTQGHKSCKTSRTKKEFIKRLLPLEDEDLFNRRVNSICKKYKFSTAPSTEDITPPTAGWKCVNLWLECILTLWPT